MRNNYRSGAVLSNDRPDSTGGVTVTGSNLVSNDGAVQRRFDHRNQRGCVAQPIGGHRRLGLGTTVASKAAVTVNKSLFNYNRSHGETWSHLQTSPSVASQPTITPLAVPGLFENLTAAAGYGVGIRYLCANSFNNNAASGLVITSNRAVTVKCDSQFERKRLRDQHRYLAAPANLGTVTLTGAVL